MRIVKSIQEMQLLSREIHAQGQSIGLVPTMGALHEGHLSLLSRIQRSSDFSVMSIFVNPTQFGPKEDLTKYPRPFEADCNLAQSRGCDVVFAPDAGRMYGPHFRTWVSVQGMTDTLCGKSRPNHFRGVTTVVLKFLNIVMPDVVIFGQKDAQQALVLRRMIADLNLFPEMIIAPTIRESDGLAMSSRNIYLTDSERREAPVIYRGLQAAETLFAAGVKAADVLAQEVRKVFAIAPALNVEYVEIVETENLETVSEIDTPALLAVACRTTESKTRLIDNIVLGGHL